MSQNSTGASRVRNIQQQGDRHLAIEWTDGVTTTHDVVELRRQCPCAMCVDENTGQRTLKPEAVADSVRPQRVDSVGRYAMTIKFDDGHGTGIYTFDYLRRLAN